MKYDKMVECSLERSKQKVETAKREIQEMLESTVYKGLHRVTV